MILRFSSGDVVSQSSWEEVGRGDMRCEQEGERGALFQSAPPLFRMWSHRGS